MADSILDSITSRYDALTKSGKKLANYLLDNAGSAQYLSISSLAENSGVSEATITRFCRFLGLSGYNDLKLALARSERAADPLPDTDSPAGASGQNTLDQLCSRLMSAYNTAFLETAEQLNPASFNRAVGLLSNARTVYCFGQGASMVMAMEAWARFSTVTDKFRHISDSHMQSMAVALAGPEDVILLVSYSGATREMQELLKLAHKRLVPVILITHFPNSQAARLADVSLICGYNESPLQAGSVAAKIGQLLLIDCLYHAYCGKNPVQSEEARNAVTSAVAQKHL